MVHCSGIQSMWAERNGAEWWKFRLTPHTSFCNPLLVALLPLHRIFSSLASAHSIFWPAPLHFPLLLLLLLRSHALLSGYLWYLCATVATERLDVPSERYLEQIVPIQAVYWSDKHQSRRVCCWRCVMLAVSCQVCPVFIWYYTDCYPVVAKNNLKTCSTCRLEVDCCMLSSA